MTLKDKKILLVLRKTPLSFETIQQKTGIPEDALNIILSSDLRELIYSENGLIHLNYAGETEAQTEIDRRIDMYLTRGTALAAIFLSIIAIIVSIFF